MIAVTGSTGQVGFELSRLLGPGGYYLDRSRLDLSQPETFANTLSKLRPKYLINAGAYTAVDKAEFERGLAMKMNRDVPGKLAQLAEELNFKLIHISTDYVFNGESSEPYREDDPKGPLNIYGESKLAGEDLVQRFSPKSLIVRTSWVYSAHGKNFVKTVLRLSKEVSEMKVVNDQTGAPTWAKDLANALLQARDLSGVYHYSNEGHCTWFELAQAIVKFRKLPMKVTPITTAEYPTPARRPRFSLLNKDKIKGSVDLKIPHWMESLELCLKELS
jgi:dTDP-4-dehydrorhamnose reductase